MLTAREDMDKNGNGEGEGDDEGPKRITDENIKKKEKTKGSCFYSRRRHSPSVKIIPVKTGISDDRYIEITEGLQPDMVIVKGPYKAISKDLEENSKIKVDNEVKKKINKEE